MSEYALKLSDDEIARYRLMAQTARAREADVWELAGILPGAVVADVGCGPGALLPLLSECVGEQGRVDAIDGDEEAVATARAVVEGTGLTNVSVRQGRAESTGLAERSYDTVMIRHVLAHNGRTAQAIVSHLADLLRPGGSLLLVDVDMTALRLRPDDEAVSELLDRYAEFQVQRGGAIQVGLHLDELLEQAGLEVLAYQGVTDVVRLPHGVRGPAWAARDAMVAAGVVTEDEVAVWGERMDALEAAGTSVVLFAARFLAVGRRHG
jgi:ubiquinone/menaquinone biosynthesis C-methylase UbiE